jgi:hypothetical protein
MDLEKLLDKIAIEEAPKDLVHRWKMELIGRKEARTRSILWPYIVLPLALSGIYVYITVFNRELLKRISDFSFQSYNNLVAFKNGLFQGFSVAKAGGFMQSMRVSFSQFLNSASEFMNTGTFLTWSIAFSIAVAAISMVWFFFWMPERERSYSKI